MKINKENIKKELKQLKFLNFIAIFIAGIINAIGVTLFLYPVNCSIAISIFSFVGPSNNTFITAVHKFVQLLF